jgi:hypothetical protein
MGMVLFYMHYLFAIVIVLLFSTSSWADIYQYTADDGSVHFTDSPRDGRGKVVIKEKAVQNEVRYSPKKNSQNIDNSNFGHLAAEKAREHNLDPKLVQAVIKAESNWNHRAVSPKGARGLMQLMPSTASLMGVSNSFNPEDNIDGGVRYLKHLIEKFNGNLTLALAAYNAGPGRVEKTRSVPAIPETVTYVNRVMSYYSGGNFLPVSYGGYKSKPDRIKKVVLNDGTILFTNSTFINQGL